MMKNQQGFTFIEVLTVLGIIALATIATLAVRDWAVGNSRVSEAKNQIITVQAGAQLWRPRNGDFTGITMTSMSQIAAVPEAWGDGAGINPWGGAINVEADLSDSSRYVVTLSGIAQDGEGARLARDFTDYSIDSTYSAGTLTLRFQG
ncbi:prepilin-type N-terminal cleavage/methylation domain-containing protein [Pseudidiomarina sp. 1APP75-32.1]|uniref:Prepilin-type N-terminal cleavage/methylation domain-containing protein n=2 Tax=Pseudidiomarina terrestris TaxID=2820060 RepID=A0AAW7QT02_9GAMM|nr:prepilin-type N-terminal cleavage/methylation domain-containing protein [Pseudidiomarina sp. 1APP75-32.1]MDN7127890.1 prepilin-type N-terminal cleavage/methylation domain-containing protein [Pseudidiomarina sp. 1APR75-33.1]MDN7128997.1 prepilin-type N-terminal cleavage/methylation domain-containing protein [Pseudidiomarina sp. 1APR75-15]MDN7134740.1 prepilin-type N-terminal cleavage/methylation domain-containing protein [Pseudidiomarina sp. 1ASP75-5]MDN7137418.1 prepilin-type N-terminal clea